MIPIEKLSHLSLNLIYRDIQFSICTLLFWLTCFSITLFLYLFIFKLNNWFSYFFATIYVLVFLIVRILIMRIKTIKVNHFSSIIFMNALTKQKKLIEIMMCYTNCTNKLFWFIISYIIQFKYIKNTKLLIVRHIKKYMSRYNVRIYLTYHVIVFHRDK